MWYSRSAAFFSCDSSGTGALKSTIGVAPFSPWKKRFLASAITRLLLVERVFALPASIRGRAVIQAEHLRLREISRGEPPFELRRSAGPVRQARVHFPHAGIGRGRGNHIVGFLYKVVRHVGVSGSKDSSSGSKLLRIRSPSSSAKVWHSASASSGDAKPRFFISFFRSSLIRSLSSK